MKERDFGDVRLCFYGQNDDKVKEGKTLFSGNSNKKECLSVAIAGLVRWASVTRFTVRPGTSTMAFFRFCSFAIWMIVQHDSFSLLFFLKHFTSDAAWRTRHFTGGKPSWQLGLSEDDEIDCFFIGTFASDWLYCLGRLTHRLRQKEILSDGTWVGSGLS